MKIGRLCSVRNKSPLDFIKKHQNDDIRKLALQADKYPDVDFPFALQQIAGRQIAANKIPSWHKQEAILYPPHIALEQCSSELTARYKASLFEGNSLVDLTGGLGVDCAFGAEKFKKVTYVERQPELCRTAQENFKTLSLNHIAVCCADAESFLAGMNPADCIFLDPARRDKHGKKTVSIADCEPDINKLKERLLQKAPTVWIKFSPMLDISLALQELSETAEIHVVSVGNECKELLFKLENAGNKEALIHCVNLKKNADDERFSFSKSEETTAECNFAVLPETYLYEPNTSILKAGAFKCITQHYPVYKLHIHSHLYTSNQFVANFPGRIFQVINFFSPNKKSVKDWLPGISQANISVRNFPLSVNELRKKTGLKEGGNIYLFATTLQDGKKVVIACRKEEN